MISLRSFTLALALLLPTACTSTRPEPLETVPEVLVGYVFDVETREPIPGATIAIEGTQLGAVTDIDGYYFIRPVPAEKATIGASSVGRFSKRMEYFSGFEGDTLRVDWLLSPGVNLDGVVVCGSRCE